MNQPFTVESEWQSFLASGAIGFSSDEEIAAGKAIFFSGAGMMFKRLPYEVASRSTSDAEELIAAIRYELDKYFNEGEDGPSCL